MDEILKKEAHAFDLQISKRVKEGHIPDLRRSGRCDYFYNNVWRDQFFANLYYGEIVAHILNAGKKYVKKDKISVLEIGCGPGHVSLELARNGFDVTGLDLSKKCIQVAKKTAADDPWIKSSRGSLNYVCDDFFNQSNKYDIVVFIASLHHFPSCYEVTKQVPNLLKPNGIVFVDEPARDLVSNKNCAIIFLIKTIFSMSDSYFENIDIPKDEDSIFDAIQRIKKEEKYELEDGSKVQSINDNESGFKEMYDALKKTFQELEFKKKYAIFHQLVGGIRLKSIEAEKDAAQFLKLIDSVLCRLNILDPTNFTFIGNNPGNES